MLFALIALAVVVLGMVGLLLTRRRVPAGPDARVYQFTPRNPTTEDPAAEG